MAASDWMTPSERRLSILLFLLSVLGAGIRTGEHLSPEVTRWLEAGGGIAEPDSAGAPEPVPAPGPSPSGNPPGPPGSGMETGSSGSVGRGGIDPSRAPASVLVELPGIGPALAARIVADRETRGPFRAPEDLLRVRGIGPATLDRIRAHLRFPGGSPTPSGGP